MKIDIGEVRVFSHYPNKHMWTGNGPRSERIHKDFDTKFKEPPKVEVALSGLDASKDHNLRVVLSVVEVTETHFTVEASTWADTKLALVDASYIAIGK